VEDVPASPLGLSFPPSRPSPVAARLGLSVNAALLARSRVLARLRREAEGLVG
jgi:hypothetical protein